MSDNQRNLLRADCYKKGCLSDKSCVICGINKPLEHSHLIPRYVFRYVAQLFFDDKELRNEWIKCGPSTVPMCCNHHTLYERRELSDEEFDLIRPQVKARLDQLQTLIQSLQLRGVDTVKLEESLNIFLNRNKN